MMTLKSRKQKTKTSLAQVRGKEISMKLPEGFGSSENYHDWQELFEDLVNTDLTCCVKPETQWVDPKDHRFTCDAIDALAFKFYELGKVHGKQVSHKCEKGTKNVN